MTLDDLRSFLVRNLASAEAVKQSIGEEALRTAYEQRLQAQPDAFTVASVRHILIGFTDAQGNARSKEEALARAQDVVGQLEAGADMASLAAEYSDDGGSQASGGLYADAPVVNWVAAFRQAAVELPVGTISDPVETEFGYHIMRVEARTVRAFDEVRAQLQEELQAEVMNRFVTEELPGLIERIDLPQPE